MSHNRKCGCIISGCKYNRELFADRVFLKRHLHTKHGHHELVDVAFEMGLIPYKEGYISHDWLIEKLSSMEQ